MSTDFWSKELVLRVISDGGRFFFFTSVTVLLMWLLQPFLFSDMVSLQWTQFPRLPWQVASRKGYLVGRTIGRLEGKDNKDPGLTSLLICTFQWWGLLLMTPDFSRHPSVVPAHTRYVNFVLLPVRVSTAGLW